MRRVVALGGRGGGCGTALSDEFSLVRPGVSEMDGAIAARLSGAGTGAVDSRLTSLARLTVMRCGIGMISSRTGCRTSSATTPTCRASATGMATLSSLRKMALSPILASGYGSVPEPLVTSDIEVKPARFSSPSTAIVRP